MAEHDRLPTDRLRDGGVLPLRITRHIHPPAETDRAGIQRFGECRLAGANDPGQHDVGGGDDPSLVEDPGVIHERSAGVEVLTDEHSLTAQPTLREERVCPGKGGGRVLMGGEPEPPPRPQRCLARLPAARQERRRCPLGPLHVRLRAGYCLPLGGVGRVGVGGGSACRAPIAAVLPGPADQHRRIQLFLGTWAHQQPTPLRQNRSAAQVRRPRRRLSGRAGSCLSAWRASCRTRRAVRVAPVLFQRGWTPGGPDRRCRVVATRSDRCS